MKPGTLSAPALVAAALCLADAADAFEKRIWVPVTRLAMGSSLHVADDAGVVGYALDASVGATTMPQMPVFPVFLLDRDYMEGFIFNAEAGYTLDTLGVNLHAFHLTAGLGYGAFALGGLVQPRLIAGTVGGETAIGMRNAIRGYYFAELISLEVGHQFVRHHGEFHHDVHLMLGLSPPWSLLMLN